MARIQKLEEEFEENEDFDGSRNEQIKALEERVKTVEDDKEEDENRDELMSEQIKALEARVKTVEDVLMGSVTVEPTLENIL